MREKNIYIERYNKHSAVIKDDLKPILRHLSVGFRCVRAEIKSAGVCELDGIRYEFQDLRVYVATSP